MADHVILFPFTGKIEEIFIWLYDFLDSFVCTLSMKEGKNQESVQSGTTPDKDTNGKVTNTQLDITNES